MRKSCNTSFALILLSVINIYILIENYNIYSQNNYEMKQRVDFMPINTNIIKINNSVDVENVENTKSKQIERYFGRDDSRDFFRYKCKNMKRVGGETRFIQSVPDLLYRIDGSWYVCLDEGVGPKKEECILLSFGINQDPTFDIEMNKDFKCQVESFDPYVIHNMFKKEGYENLTTVKVNDKWRFHKIGLTGSKELTREKGKKGWIATLDEILKYTQLTNKTIDIFKMDIENSEWSFIINLDIDYACKYFKQFMVETHTAKIDPGVYNQNKKFNPLKELRKLEKCFSMFHRDTRFYQFDKPGPYGFWPSEFQVNQEFKLDLKNFKNELELIDYMVSFGELYFVNENFVKN